MSPFAMRDSACKAHRRIIMSRVLLCSVVLLSAACSSSAPGGGGTAGTTASGGGAAGSSSGAGASGTPTSSAGASAEGGATGVAGGLGGAGAPANAGAGGAASAGAGAGGVNAGGASAGSGGAAVGNESVTQRGADNAKTSHWLAPTLTKTNVMTKMALDANFKANFKGEFTSSPLFLAGATPGTGRFFAATTENDVYALDEMTGAVITGWPHNIGGYLVDAPVCGGDPKNHGIVGTPVIDATAKRIYVAAAMADGHQEVHALATDTGMEVTGWPVNISKIDTGVAGGFQSAFQNQRSALTLVSGILYVAYGGYCGDANQYRGFVFGINTADPTKVGSWYTKDNRQSGIWAAGGFPSDGNGIFAVTGNAGGVSGNHDNSDSEEILRITGLGVASRDPANLFYPTEWVDPMNNGDQDFGSASPAIVSVPDGKPSSIIVAPAKPGRVYFLDATNLGGSLGQFADMVVASTAANSSSVYTSPAAYQAASGVHVAIATGGGSVCPNAMTLNAAVMSILLKPSAAGMVPMPSKVWCAAIGGGDTSKRAPIATNSAGSADPIVWYMNGGNLNAFDGEDGTVLYDSSSTKGGATASSCAGIHKFTSLMAVNGRIVVGGDSGGNAHLCSWSVH